MLLPNSITIKDTFTEQYTLTIDSDLMAVNAVMQSKTQIRWELCIVDIKEDFFEARLLLLDQILLEANNPLIKEISNLTKTFSRMYNELHLLINSNGKIVEVINAAAILDKWKQTKAELSAIAENNPEIKNIIVLNDSIFTNKENLIATLQRSEFFLLFFNDIFGNRLPYDNVNFRMPNFLNTTNLNWRKQIQSVQADNNGIAALEVDSTPVFIPNDYNERAYSQFKDRLDIKKLKPVLNESGNYLIDANQGRIISAYLKREEVAHNDLLYSKLVYEFISDSKSREKKVQGNGKAQFA